MNHLLGAVDTMVSVSQQLNEECEEFFDAADTLSPDANGNTTNSDDADKILAPVDSTMSTDGAKDTTDRKDTANDCEDTANDCEDTAND